LIEYLNSMFFALAFRFAKCALRFKNCNRFAGDFGRVRGASDGSGGGQGKGVDWRAHGAIRARREAHLEGGCGTRARPSAGGLSTDAAAAVNMGDFFPPSRPRYVVSQGDTPWTPAARAPPSLHSPGTLGIA
jgi:hypothetical protein